MNISVENQVPKIDSLSDSIVEISSRKLAEGNNLLSTCMDLTRDPKFFVDVDFSTEKSLKSNEAESSDSFLNAADEMVLAGDKFEKIDEHNESRFQWRLLEFPDTASSSSDHFPSTSSQGKNQDSSRSFTPLVKVKSLYKELQRKNKVFMDSNNRKVNNEPKKQSELTQNFPDAIVDLIKRFNEQEHRGASHPKENEIPLKRISELAESYVPSELGQHEAKVSQEQIQMELYADKISQLLTSEIKPQIVLETEIEKFQRDWISFSKHSNGKKRMANEATKISILGGIAETGHSSEREVRPESRLRKHSDHS